MQYDANREYEVRVELSAPNNETQIYVDGKRVGVRRFFAPVHSIERIVFRTGALRQHPTPETPADNFTDLPDAGEKKPLATFYIRDIKTSNMSGHPEGMILKYDDFSHHVDYFNRMEDENIVRPFPTVNQMSG